jgi:hypothetical protein
MSEDYNREYTTFPLLTREPSKPGRPTLAERIVNKTS